MKPCRRAALLQTATLITDKRDKQHVLSRRLLVFSHDEGDALKCQDQVKMQCSESRLGRGGRAYLWRLPSRQSGGKVIITAHGCARNGITSALSSQNRIGPRLHFFCSHGQSMEDEGLRMYTNAREIPAETVVANAAPDYLLQKYTNTRDGSRTHNSVGEDYGSVRNTLTLPRPAPEESADIAARFFMAGDTGHFQSNMDRAFEANFRPDVITIRGRLMGYGCVRLSDLLSWLEDSGFYYNDIYCAFCRSSSPAVATEISDQFFREMS